MNTETTDPTPSEGQDLSAMYAAIKFRQGGVGRSAMAPQMLLGLWL